MRMVMAMVTIANNLMMVMAAMYMGICLRIVPI